MDEETINALARAARAVQARNEHDAERARAVGNDCEWRSALAVSDAFDLFANHLEELASVARDYSQPD